MKKHFYYLIILQISIFCSAQNNENFTYIEKSNIQGLMNKLSQKGLFNGCILLGKKDEIIYKKAFGFKDMENNYLNQLSTKFTAWSVTKPITAILTLKLIEEGKLSLDCTIAQVFKEFKPSFGNEITVEHLMSHTSGIPDFVNFGFVPQGQKQNKKLFIKGLANVKLSFKPGSKYEYANSSYILLAFIIEEITGVSYNDNLKKYIFDPLNMKNSWSCSLKSQRKNVANEYFKEGENYQNLTSQLDVSIFKGAGSLYTTVEDLFLLDQALYTEKILSENSIQKMYKPQIKGENYGLGWELFNVPGVGGMYAHLGGLGSDQIRSLIIRFIDKNYTIIILSNSGFSEKTQNEIIEAAYQLLNNNKKVKIPFSDRYQIYNDDF